MIDYRYQNNYDNGSWENIPEDVWQKILIDFIFKVADNFGFLNVGNITDLFPKGLNYFSTWNLDENGLVELEHEIIVKFKLNEKCKNMLLEHKFSVHQLFSDSVRDYKEYDERHYYYEFDELYFFSGNRLLFTYIHHQSEIVFQNLNDSEIILLMKLDKRILNDLAI